MKMQNMILGALAVLVIAVAVWNVDDLIFAPTHISKSKAIEESNAPKNTDVVLAILSPRFHGNNETGVIVGMNNRQTIAEDRALIVKYREWLKTQPSDVVSAYEYWLWFYERGCNEAETAIENNAAQKFKDRWDRDVEQKLAAAAIIARTYPKPP